MNLASKRSFLAKIGKNHHFGDPVPELGDGGRLQRPSRAGWRWRKNSGWNSRRRPVRELKRSSIRRPLTVI